MVPFWLLVSSLVCLPGGVLAQDITIACAANFKSTLVKLGKQFEHNNQIEVTIITASSGVLFTQISHGAPFDIFLSANADYARKLGTRLKQDSFVYAIGRLAFWAPKQSVTVSLPTDRELFENFQARLAIANPATAPYGTAAIEVLGKLKPGFSNLVRGNNVSQVYQFIESGNVSAGLLARSQINHVAKNQYWLIPQNLHAVLEQRGILLDTQNTAAITFVSYLQSPGAQQIIVSAGYQSSSAAPDTSQSM